MQEGLLLRGVARARFLDIPITYSILAVTTLQYEGHNRCAWLKVGEKVVVISTVKSISQG